VGNDLVSVATSTTCNLASAQSTFTFYTEESDSDDENSNSVAKRPSYEDVGLPVADAVEAILAEISELDTRVISHLRPAFPAKSIVLPVMIRILF
jgi:hypothetical protein